jgi:diguanylate cyclase (GGDEF)-like protein
MQMRPKFTRLHAKYNKTISYIYQRLAPVKQSKAYRKALVIIEQRAPRSLANRILTLQLAWAFIIYILVIAALWFATNLVIESNVRLQGEGWISKLDELGIPIYASNDPTQLADAISYMHNFPEVLRAQYIDVSGKKIISGYTRKNITLSNFLPLSDSIIAELKRTDLSQKTIRFEKGNNSQMRVIAPIWIKSIENDGMIDFSLKKKGVEKVETIGIIDIVIDYSQISTNLKRNLAYASIIIAIMILIAAFIGRIMIRWALNPLSDLEEPLTRLANGETDVTVKSSGDKEIARIGMALNTTISALKERDEALRRMANHDNLTGLVNRKYFVEQLKNEVNRITTTGGSSALFFFDLDRFKYINDTYGHAAGDRLLVQISAQLSKRIRGRDLVARFGGDEFTLLAYNTNLKGAQEIAESFLQLMRDFTFYEAGDALKIYFSIGVTIIDADTHTSHDYLKEADTAVHDAKSHGRNGYKIFQRNKAESTRESGTGWHERLQSVLVLDQVIPYYQPLIGLKNQSMHIHEVLLRLPDTDQGVIRPGAFMPAAERFGLMGEFDRQMIKKVAQVLSVQKDPDLIFSLNLSEQFITEKNSIDFLKSIISEYHVSPAHFVFEISEQHILKNIEKLKSFIPTLSELGFRFAIDDFCAGFGSLNYIKHFPVHFIKIDSSLIEHITEDNIDRITVSAIVEIATSLNMQTIAKFVPDKKSVSLLKKLGIDFAQGNFVGEPSSILNV